jgi:ubiquitin C-terminal hydrolase
MSATDAKEETKDIDLMTYDTLYETKAVGITNYGNTCYFNSIVQALLSLTSLFKVISKKYNESIVHQNFVLQALYKIHSNPSNIDNEVNTLRKQLIINNISQSTDKIKLGFSSQEDSHEMFTHIMDEITKCPLIRLLFEHRHINIVSCLECKEESRKIEENFYFIVEPNLTSSEITDLKDVCTQPISLNKYLGMTKTFVDDFICPGCKSKKQKTKTMKVTMLPEILCIVFKKFTEKTLTPFPKNLVFNSNKEGYILSYELVAQIEHSGTTNGGHFYSYCKRSDGWKELNDSSVSDHDPQPTPNTYLVFYHFMGLKKINS